MTSSNGPHTHPTPIMVKRLATYGQTSLATLASGVERLFEWAVQHWLLVASLMSIGILLGAAAAPVLRAAAFDAPAWVISTVYRLICLQRPSHSYFLLGYPMALEQRMLAMVAAQFVGGLIYSRLRRPLPWLDWRLVAVLSLPMAWDIGSQMIGLRDSDWLTRTWTGGLAALPGVLWFYPLVDHGLRPGIVPARGEGG